MCVRMTLFVSTGPVVRVSRFVYVLQRLMRCQRWSQVPGLLREPELVMCSTKITQ